MTDVSDRAPDAGERPEVEQDPDELDDLLRHAHPESDAPPELAAAIREMEYLRLRMQNEREKRKKAEKKAKAAGKGESLGTNRGIETMFRTSYRTHVDLSHLADNKANIMISINGIIISILLASISPKIDANPWLLLPTAFLLVGCLGSLVYAILAARPRVSSHVVSLEDVRSDRSNILFFGNFVTLEEDEFVEGMKELITDTDRLYVNMIRDIFSLGGVLAKKFKLLRVSYNIFMVGLVVGVLLFIAVFAQVAVAGGGLALDPFGTVTR
jgi:hypothetical protein